GRHRHADVQLATLTASRRSCPRLLDADRNFPDDHEHQGFWQVRSARSRRQRTGACCQPPGRDRHSGFETYHERPSRRAKVIWAIQVRCRHRERTTTPQPIEARSARLRQSLYGDCEVNLDLLVSCWIETLKWLRQISIFLLKFTAL